MVNTVHVLTQLCTIVIVLCLCAEFVVSKKPNKETARTHTHIYIHTHTLGYCAEVICDVPKEPLTTTITANMDYQHLSLHHHRRQRHTMAKLLLLLIGEY